MRNVRLAGLLTLAALLAPGWVDAQSPLNERLPAARDGTVKITSAIGTITVHGWERDSVAVTGDLGDPASRLEFSSEGREARIRVVLPEAADADRAPRLVVRVPKGSHVAVRSSTGDIEVREVEGAVDLESVSGGIAVSGWPRMVYAETAAGEIEIEAVTKVIRATSLNGDVTVSGARGYIEVSTVGGRARVVGAQVWEGEVKTVSGDIVFEGSFDPSGSFNFESHSGDIEVSVPADARIDFDITTILSDRVTNDFAPSAERTFSIGGGGTRVRIKSFKGQVRVLERRASDG